MGLTRLSVYRPVIALTVAVALVLFGVISYVSLGPEQNHPDRLAPEQWIPRLGPAPRLAQQPGGQHAGWGQHRAAQRRPGPARRQGAGRDRAAEWPPGGRPAGLQADQRQ